jgi:hypothetical protein
MQLGRELGTLRADGIYADRKAQLAAQIGGWQPPARAATAAELINWRDALPSQRPQVGDSETTIIVHEMRTPSGPQRLVIVSFTAVQYIEDLEPQKAPHRHFEIQTQRTFTAHVIDPHAAMPRAFLTRLVIDDPKPARTQLLAVFAADDDPRPVVDHRPWKRWRIFPGQVDPADPTHLTIPYEIDGTPGLIDGRLNDGDRLMLTPRAGRLARWTSGTEYRWDLTAGNSATRASALETLKVR